MTDGLTERDRQGILSVLEAFPKIKRAVLFGSRAIGTFRGASDLDLAIEGDDLNLADLVAVRSQIGRLKLPFEADLVIRAKITNSDVEKHIQKYGRVFYERKTTKSNLSGWRETTFSSVIDVKHGFAFPGENIRDTPPGDILLTPGNFAIGGGFKGDKFKYFDGDVPEEYVLNEGDLLVTMTDLSKQADTLGFPAIVPKTHGPRFLHNQRLGKVLIKPGAELDARFLFYLLHSAEYRHEVLASATGTTVKHTSPGRILAHKANIPILDVQKVIASVLGALDDKIELNRRMNETLEALAQSLFKSWFVDATQSALPKGWRYATIAELCEINSWTLGKGDELDQIEYVEISEVMRGNIANIQSYERGEEPSRARRRLRHGDTVLSTVRPDRGAYFLCLNPSPDLIGSTGFAVLTPSKTPWSFIHAAMTQADVFEYLGQQADGGAYPAVRPEIIAALEVPWPNKPELVEEFHRACAPLYERAEINRQESRTLAALRDALLPKLLSGKLRVPAAAGKLVEATA